MITPLSSIHLRRMIGRARSITNIQIDICGIEVDIRSIGLGPIVPKIRLSNLASLLQSDTKLKVLELLDIVLIGLSKVLNQGLLFCYDNLRLDPSI